MLTRREFLQLTALLPLFAYLPNPTLPNIILIMADDLGWGDLGCYGQATIQTPHLDALASQGLRFTQAYSASPVCSPSRWSMLTGKHQGHAHTTLNPETVLLPEDSTFTQQLQTAGYSTACIGKWGLGAPGGKSPNEAGFDYFLGYAGTNQQATDYFPATIQKNGADINAGGQYFPELQTRRAVEFIREAGGPFFLYLPFTLPHNSPGPEVPDDTPYSLTGWTQAERDFAAMVTRLDGYVGQIVAAAPPNTLVLFGSDNGAQGEGGHSAGFFGSTGGLRGHKRQLYEGGIRVPLVASWPGVIAPGVSGHVCGLFDLGATILEAVGLGASWGDGVSLLPSFLGLNQPVHDHLYFAFTDNLAGDEFREAVRWGPWKAVRSGVGPVELYDLAGDPGEAVDVAASEPGVAGHLGELMDGYCPEPKQCRQYFGVMK